MSVKEIMKLPGMPNSRVGVRKRAEREGWEKREQVGVQGSGFEFFVPVDETKHVASKPDLQVSAFTGHVNNETLIKLLYLYEQLKDENLDELVDILQRKGTEGVLLPEKIRQIALMLCGLPDEYLKEILLLANEAQYCVLTGAPFNPVRFTDLNKRKSTG